MRAGLLIVIGEALIGARRRLVRDLRCVLVLAAAAS